MTESVPQKLQEEQALEKKILALTQSVEKMKKQMEDTRTSHEASQKGFAQAESDLMNAERNQQHPRPA